MKKSICIVLLIMKLVGSSQGQSAPKLWERYILGNATKISSVFVDSVQDVIYFGTEVLPYHNGQDTTKVGYWDGTQVHYLPNPYTDSNYGWRSGREVQDIIRYQGKLYIASGENLFRYNEADSTWTNLFQSIIINRRPIINGFKVRNGLLLMYWGTFGQQFPGMTESANIIQYDGVQFKTFLNTDSTLYKGVMFINDVQDYKGELYATGNFNLPSFQHPTSGMNEIMRWDGSHWYNLKSGLGVDGMFGGGNMEEYMGKLWVSGNFREPTGPGNGIAMWDGTDWYRIGDGITAYGSIAHGFMLAKDGYMWMSFLDRINSQPCNTFAKYNGTSWCCLSGHGANIIKPLHLFEFRDSIYAWGCAYTLDGVSISPIQYDLFKWVGGDYVDDCNNTVDVTPSSLVHHSHSDYKILTIYPNPAAHDIHVSSDDKLGSIIILDVLGRMVLQSETPLHEIDLDISHLSTGTYYFMTASPDAIGRAVMVKE